MQQPTRLISTPFAQEGEKTEIQNVTGEFDNSATYRLGFPPITMQSIRLGGKPPKGTDFNGVLFDITENISFLCKGGRYQYNAGLSTLMGGYPEGSNLLLDDNVTEVVSTVAGNQNNPNTDMTGWKLKPTKASSVLSDGNQNQQEINDFGGAKWYAKAGGYELGATVKLDNGDTVQSTVAVNTANPNADMTGWKKPTVDAYTKSESDELLLQKANMVDVYQKTETYTKSEVDSAITPKADKTYVDDAVGAISTDASKQYATLALANADIANIPLNKNVFVSEEVNGGYWYKAAAWAVTLTKSPYDPLTQAETFTKSTIDKSSQLNGWFDPSFKTLDMSAKSYFGRERFWNSYAGWSKVKNTFFDGFALRRADGYNQTTFGGFTTYLDELGLTTGDELTAYVLCVGNASTVYSAIRFHDAADAVIGTTQLMTNEAGADNLVTSLTAPKWLRKTLTIPANAVKLVVYPYNFSGSVGFDVLSFWVAAGNSTKVSKLPLFNSTFQDLKNNDLNNKILAPYGVYLNSKHVTEKVGNADYLNLNKMGGFYEIASKTGYVNTIQCRIWKTTPSDMEVKIFIRESSDAATFTPSTTTAAASFNILAADFPATEKDLTISLATPLYLEANQKLYVLFRAVDGGTFNMKRWLYDAAATPARHGFPFSTASDWTTAFSISGPTIGYGQTSMALTKDSGEFNAKSDAVNIRYGSTNVDAALKAIEAAMPSANNPVIILPPKIYAVQNKEANVYFDNLLVSPIDDYLVDVSASVGIQQRERFTINTATISTANATITLSDKKSGVQLSTATTSLQVVSSSAKSGTTQKVSVIGDSTTNAGVITQTLLDLAATDVMGVQLIGTLGTGLNRHEGRGGWGVANYTTAGPTYYAFTVSGVSVEPLINATEYTNNGTTFRVQTVSLTGGSGTIVCSVQSGTSPAASGTLTKSNAVAGDASIAFSASVAQSGNPFWIGGVVDYPQYLINNGLATPDFVAIMLGINDVFGQTSDAAATSTANTRLTQLDTLINSIKAVNGTIKVLLMIPPPPANQDAFGKNYLVGETSWRHKRNMLMWAQAMITKYSGQEANRIYLVPTNVAIDTVNNYPTETVAVNSRNLTTVARQSNGVHPATSGYQQIGDAVFYALKAI